MVFFISFHRPTLLSSCLPAVVSRTASVGRWGGVVQEKIHLCRHENANAGKQKKRKKEGRFNPRLTLGLGWQAETGA